MINRNGQKIHFNSLEEYIENIIQSDLKTDSVDL